MLAPIHVENFEQLLGANGPICVHFTARNCSYPFRCNWFALLQEAPISLDGFGGGHLHLLLEDGACAILTGKSNNNGTFDIGAGPDSLIVWDNKDGINDPYFQGSLAVLGTAPENLNIM
jgi:hypothetical protein